MDEQDFLLETERLRLRRMTPADEPSLRFILQDPEVMTAYEGPFSDEEVRAWLDKMLRRYREDGIGLYAVILRESGEMIGQCGLTWQELPDRRVMEVGYLFRRDYWHQGYATEAAIACREYAFRVLHAPEVYSIIWDTNLPSQRVARRNGMMPVGSFVKHYRGVDMPHIIFCVQNDM